MRKVYLTALLLFVFGGCQSEDKKQTEADKQIMEKAKIIQLDTALESERIRLGLSQDEWEKYINLKRSKYGGKEYSRGKNWRERVLKHAEKDLQLYIARKKVVARFQAAYPDTWEQKLLEYDIEQERTNRLYQEQRRQQRRQIWLNSMTRPGENINVNVNQSTVIH